MPTRKTSKMGRPKKEIAKGQFKKLCNIQCTEEEIADFFGCSVDTIERWCKKAYGMTFAEAFKKESAGGKISLRRYQFSIAKRNSAMAIFLGKQYLGQKDNPQEESEDLTGYFKRSIEPEVRGDDAPDHTKI